MKVPDILVSGNHEEIKSWRMQKSIERTLERRIDLISEKNFQINKLIDKDLFKKNNDSLESKEEFYYDP